MESVLISIKPKYVRHILSGRKTVELRKCSARIAPGTRIVIYATSPHCAVVGDARISFREQLPVRQLWRRHGQHAAVEHREFYSYYANASEGVAFGLEDVRPFPAVVSLAMLRGVNGGFRPPQSYMRTPAFVEQLVGQVAPQQSLPNSPGTG